MFNTFLVTPLYNALIAIIGITPNGDAGLAIIALTILVSLALFPVTKRSLVTQVKMKQYEGELKAIKERYKNEREVQAKKMLEFYREKGINPFANLLLLFLQLPLVIALYYMFMKAGLPEVDAGRLYSFVSVPDGVTMIFLGIIDISHKSITLAVLAAAAQFIQGWFSPALAAAPEPAKPGEKPSFESSFAATMRIQVRFVLPVIIFMVSYQHSVIALYFATRSLFMFCQEMMMRGVRLGEQTNGN